MRRKVTRSFDLRIASSSFSLFRLTLLSLLCASISSATTTTTNTSSTSSSSVSLNSTIESQDFKQHSIQLKSNVTSGHLDIDLSIKVGDGGVELAVGGGKENGKNETLTSVASASSTTTRSRAISKETAETTTRSTRNTTSSGVSRASTTSKSPRTTRKHSSTSSTVTSSHSSILTESSSSHSSSNRTTTSMSPTETTESRSTRLRTTSTSTSPSKSTPQSRKSSKTDASSSSRRSPTKSSLSSTRTTSSAYRSTSKAKASVTTKSKGKSSTRTTTETQSKSRHSSTTSSSRPSPTSYGTAPKKGCIPPPSTFTGSSEGFSTLCTIRYCDAQPRRNMIWSGNDGEVTREEIESALGMLQQLEPLWENGNGNVLGDGYLGQGAYSASLLFEITGDVRALDVAVRIADNILALQNQNTKNPLVIWTGDVDPVWPTGDLPPSNKSELIYAGCEQGEIVSNMVNAALLILKSPCLWKMVPPVFDGPTVFNDTTTYYDRALAYIAAGDDTYENYFFRFLDSAGSIIQPADGRWWATGDTRDPGTLMPWNRRMQMVHGYLKLAAAHETQAAYAPNITNYYDQIVQRNVMDFLGALNQTRGRQEGMDVFHWDYSAGEEHTEESKGIHALYDIFGSWLSWQRSSATYYLSNNFGLTMAQTFQHEINLGNGSFAGLVTGESTKKAYTIDSLWGHWSFYGYFLPEWYQTVANSNAEHGFQGRTWLAIPLLWTKHALHVNDLTFWTGLYSNGYGFVLGTEREGSYSSSSIQWGSASPSHPRSSTFYLLTIAVGGVGVVFALS